MMKIVSFFVLFFVSNILSAQETYLIYGAKEKYFLVNGERVLGIDSNVLKLYQPFDPDDIHQVPLQRFVQGVDYQLFIGLALFDSPESILNYYNSSNDYSILMIDELRGKKVVYYKVFAKFNGGYNFKLIFRTRKSRYTVVFNFFSYDREKIEDIWNQPDFFEKRFHKKLLKDQQPVNVDF